MKSDVFAKSKMPQVYCFSIVDHAYTLGHGYGLDNGLTLPLVKVGRSSKILHARNFMRDQCPEDVVNYILSFKL